MRQPYGKCLLVVVLAYALGYGALLLWSRGLPYVLDNNESFSSLWHAYNLYHFDIRKSWGLTDEACSPHAEAHPYVHTHQGNFPRLFAFLLFVLGARTIESQIVATTLTVGVAGIVFAYHFFSRLAGPRFALVACLFLMTDYVLFAQWQVVTYRVWHGFFLFSSLLCVRGAGGPRKGLAAALTLLNFLCLYYFEFVFVAFVTLTAALYAATLYRRRPGVILRTAVPAAAGAAVAVLVFVGQLAGYVGVRGLVQDAAMTLHARNSARPGGAAARALHAFYDRHAIIFWPNYFDASPYRNLAAAWQSFLTWNLGPYTPLLALTVLLLVAGLLAGALLNGRISRPVGPRWLGLLTRPPQPRRAEARALLNLAAFLFLALGWDRFLTALVGDRAHAGFAPAAAAGGLRLAPALVHVAACGLALLAGRWAAGRWWGFVRLPPLRVGAAGGLLLAGAALVRNQHLWYDHHYEPLWELMRRGPGGTAVPPLALACAAAVAVVLVLRPRRLLGRADVGRLGELARYLGCGAAAYLVVYLLFPGYLHTGYLWRFVSFAVFFTNAALAAAFFFLLRPLYREAVRWRLSVGRLPRAALALGLGLTVLFFATYWVRLQVCYLRAMPPDGYAFLRLLAKPPYRGASFVTNAYALPVAAATGEWAYKDDTIATGVVQLGKTGYLVARDQQTYLWLADRATNPAYARPDYLLLVRQPLLVHAMSWLPGQPPPAETALTQPLVASPSPYLHHRVVAQDRSGRGRWVILKADWDYPPYLAPLTEDDPLCRVRLDLAAASSGQEVRVRYRYAQQEGKPEAGTVVRLYAVEPGGASRLLAEQTGQTTFRLPPGFAGNLKASVTPATATKRGPEFFSEPRRVGDVPSARPPYLRPLPGRADGSCVGVSLVTGRRGDALRLEYQYAQDENEPESGSLARLYLEGQVGQLILVAEARGGKELTVPVPLPGHPDPSQVFRVSVTPRSAGGTGREYFCPEKIPVASFARPILIPVFGPNAPRVQVSVTRGPSCTALAVAYAYGHPFRAREQGTVVRLYRADGDSLTPLREEKDVRVLLLEPGFRGKVRVSVTPCAGAFPGPEYFSDPVEIGD